MAMSIAIRKKLPGRRKTEEVTKPIYQQHFEKWYAGREEAAAQTSSQIGSVCR